VSPEHESAWLVVAVALFHGLTVEPENHGERPTSEDPYLVLASLGRALGRALEEEYGREQGLLLASVFFDGLMDRWMPEP
jgi:hypothetical protein